MVYDVTVTKTTPKMYQPVRVCVSVIVMNDKDEYLITLRGDQCPHNQGKWEFPCGKMEQSDDTTESAALRELKEETGLTDVILLPEFKLHRGPNRSWLAFYHCVRVFGNPEITLEPGYTVDHRWVKREELESYDLTPYVRDFIETQL